jgi:hypothetical protein
MKSKYFLCLAAWAAAAWGMAGTASAEEPIFYQVRIRSTQTMDPEGPGYQQHKARMTKFIEHLRAELVVENLGDADIGCNRCGELVEAEKVEGLEPRRGPVMALLFALPRSGSQLAALARSYDMVQASELGEITFVMEIDGTPPPGSACTAQQIDWGCRTRAQCVQTGGCDKPYGGACNLCKQ